MSNTISENLDWIESVIDGFADTMIDSPTMVAIRHAHTVLHNIDVNFSDTEIASILGRMHIFIGATKEEVSPEQMKRILNVLETSCKMIADVSHQIFEDDYDRKFYLIEALSKFEFTL